MMFGSLKSVNMIHLIIRLLFVVRPKPIHMEVIANMTKDKLNQRRSIEAALKQHGIIFVPRHSRFCEEKCSR